MDAIAGRRLNGQMVQKQIRITQKIGNIPCTGRGLQQSKQLQNKHKLVMPHDTVGVVVVQHPSEGFGQVIGRIDDTRDEFHNNRA